MSARREQIHSKDFHARSEYVHNLFCQENQAQLNAKRRAEEIHPEMMITPQEGKILQCLIRSIQAEKVIEVGAFTGYSASWIVKALPSQGFFWTLDIQKEHADLARLSLSEMQPACHYDVIEGPALESLKKLEKYAPIDAIFIDANKDGYTQYLDWAEKYLKKGGLIIGDNAYLFGHIYKESKSTEISSEAWTSMHQFNKRLSDPQKYTSTILPTEEGLLIAFKEF